jgi:hypothetical protein
MGSMAVLASRGQFVTPRQGLAVKAVRKLSLFKGVAVPALHRGQGGIVRKFATKEILVAAGTQVPAMQRGLILLRVNIRSAVFIAVAGETGRVVNRRGLFGGRIDLGLSQNNREPKRSGAQKDKGKTFTDQ